MNKTCKSVFVCLLAAAGLWVPARADKATEGMTRFKLVNVGACSAFRDAVLKSTPRLPGRPRYLEADYNRDGVIDEWHWSRDHFRIYLRDKEGNRASKPLRLEIDVEFDSDDPSLLAAPFGVRERRLDHPPEGRRTGRVLHQVRDFNGDGIVDLAVFSLEGDNLWKMRFAYEVYFGQASADGGTEFPTTPGASIRSRGIPFDLQVHDFDNDDQLDVAVTVIRPGLFKAAGLVLSGIFTKSFSQDLRFYRMDQGVYPGKPNLKRKVRAMAVGESGEKAAVFPEILFGDVDGDGVSDLVVQHRFDELRVFIGVGNPHLYASRPVKIRTALPRDEGNIWLADIRGNGRNEIVIRLNDAGDGDGFILVLGEANSH